MKDNKVLIETFDVTTTKGIAGIKEIQKKLNQWNTTGLLIKYEIHTANNHVIFNIGLRKTAK